MAATEAVAARYEADRVPAVALPFGSRLNLCVYVALHRVARSFRPDVIHIFENKDVLPTMVVVRGRIPLVFYRCACVTPSKWNPLDQLIYFRRGGVDRFAACSQATATSLVAAGVAPEKVVKLHPGFDPTEFEEDPRDLRQECGISPLVPLLGYVANIRPVKGFDILVKAIKLLNSTPLQVVVIGKDPGGAAEQMTREEGLASQFRFLGHRPRAFRWMRSMDALIIPSRSEGLSKAAIEAMSLNRVVIASRVGGLLEFIEDGDDGFLVPPESPVALAEAIKRVLNDADLRQKIGERARCKIGSRFSIEAAADRALSLYRDLSLAGGSGKPTSRVATLSGR